MIVQNVLAKKLLLLAWRKARSVDADTGRKVVSGVPLSELPSELPKALVRSLRGGARGALEEVKKELFTTLEEYFTAKNESYSKCSKCGAPNPEGEKLCIYCGAKL